MTSSLPISLLRSDEQVLSAYRKNYRLGDEVSIHEIRKHVQLEAYLTRRLMSSTADDRAEVFRQAYGELYRELPWLKNTGGVRNHSQWLRILDKNSRIIEIGSGNGSLVRFLSQRGYSCVGTDLSDQRGAALSSNCDEVEWQFTDGVNLSELHGVGSFDHVISDQVVEHIHPDDILHHLRSTRALLREGGSYVLRTPHRSAGPHDLSRVLGFDKPCFMHLREYSFREIRNLSREAGYGRAVVLIGLPGFGLGYPMVLESSVLSAYNFAVDYLEDLLVSDVRLRRAFRRCGKWALVPSSVWLKLWNV